MLSKDFHQKVDIVFLDCFTLYGLKDLLFAHSPMRTLFPQMRVLQKNISKLTDVLLNENGGLYLLYGAWKDKNAELLIFTFYILTHRLSLYKIGKLYGTKHEVLMAMSSPETALTSRYPTREQRLTLFQSTLVNTSQSLFMTTIQRIQARMEDCGESGISTNRNRLKLRSQHGRQNG